MHALEPQSKLTIANGGRTIAWLLDVQAKRYPERAFFIWEPFASEARRFTYNEFARAVERVAGGLQRRGIIAGEHVLIYLDNCPELLLTWFACARIGAVSVFANTRSAPDELRYYAEHSQAVAAVTQPSYSAAVAAALPNANTFIVIDYDPASERGERIVQESGHAFDSLLSAAPVAAHPSSALAPVSVLYTSGTTGRPKGVVWTHANALWAGKINAAHEGLDARDVQYVCYPLSHINAQGYGVLASLWAGARFVLQPRFSASRFWEISTRHGCTFASQIYFALRALSTKAVPESHNYRLWGTGMCGHSLEEKFRVPMIGWWGMTETISHPIIGDLLMPNRRQTIGYAAPEYSVAVIDQSGRAVEPGKTGDLIVRGTPGVSLFSHYLHDPAATRAAYDEAGWFKTGDRVSIHDDGAFVFGDRSKDMLKVGAENVAASEIERVIAAVKGVREVAVVGAPDEMLEEVPVAFVIAAGAPGGLETDILRSCAEKLAGFKVPRSIRIVEDLPRSTLEKVAKHKLREILRSEQAASKAP